jgi:hypothetical protein
MGPYSTHSDYHTKGSHPPSAIWITHLMGSSESRDVTLLCTVMVEYETLNIAPQATPTRIPANPPWGERKKEILWLPTSKSYDKLSGTENAPLC